MRCKRRVFNAHDVLTLRALLVETVGLDLYLVEKTKAFVWSPTTVLVALLLVASMQKTTLYVAFSARATGQKRYPHEHKGQGRRRML